MIKHPEDGSRKILWKVTNYKSARRHMKDDLNRSNRVCCTPLTLNSLLQRCWIFTSCCRHVFHPFGKLRGHGGKCGISPWKL